MVCPISQSRQYGYDTPKIQNRGDGIFTVQGAGYRSYSPELGRWVNRDPIGEDGGDNLYSFIFGNPISLMDFLGNHVLTGNFSEGSANITGIASPTADQQDTIDKAWCMAKRIAFLIPLLDDWIKNIPLPSDGFEVGDITTTQIGWTITFPSPTEHEHIVMDSGFFPARPLGNGSIFQLSNLGGVLMHESVHFYNMELPLDDNDFLNDALNAEITDMANRLFAAPSNACCTINGTERRVSNKLQLIACLCGVPVGTPTDGEEE